MHQCLIVIDADHKPGRVYSLSNNMLTLLSNTLIQFAVPPGLDPISVVAEHETRNWPTVPFSHIEIRDLHVGKYFPSVARPLYPGHGGNLNPNATSEIEIAKNTWRELEIIVHDLEQCFNVTSPFEDNYSAFGIFYEKLIYFACIGVESLLRKILEDNGHTCRWMSMSSFVKLEPYLHLAEYSVRIDQYPWLPPIQPFDGWTASAPSQSLPWFQAYNVLKHDKRKSETLASMRHALSSAAAYYILSYAVFGTNLFPGYISDRIYFHLHATPKWAVHEYYFKADDNSWTPMFLTL
jgi:hypothetical protein